MIARCIASGVCWRTKRWAMKSRAMGFGFVAFLLPSERAAESAIEAVKSSWGG